jgi:hypothetical protein
MAPGELREAMRLQASFHAPGAAPGAVRWQVASSEHGHHLLLLAPVGAVAGNAKCIVPEPLALVGLALWRNLLGSAASTLLVGVDHDRALTVMAAGTEVVLMREIPLPQETRGEGAWAADLVRDLRLACQAVYLRAERRPLRPDRTVVFSSPLPEVSARLTPAAFGEVRWVVPEDCLSPDEAGTERGTALVLAGLACLGSRKRRFRHWNLRPRAVRPLAAVRRALVWSLPLWPVALGLYYEGEWRLGQARSAALQGRLQALAPKSRELAELSGDVTAMSELAESASVGIESPQRWHEVLDALETGRPPGVQLTVFSGRLDGVLLASGKSPDYERVTDYVQSLMASPRLADVALLFSEACREGVEFQLSLRLCREDVAGTPTPAPGNEKERP